MMRAGCGVRGLAMDDLVGRALGPYELIDRIGAGGMATVYRGVHRALGQPRAIKILSPALAADENLVERFMSEAKIASSLRHPNIVSIYDVGEQDGFYYLVMDVVEGLSLGRLLRQERRLELGRTLGLLRQLASALDYAHGQGVIHRDIKASNAIVGENDHVSLFDFGIARVAAGISRLTLPGQVVGTPEYLAPELITGSEGDRRADFYSLGVLAFQMLAGRLPFVGGDTMAVLYAQVSKAPPSLCALRPDLPAAVERVVLRELAKTPEARYPTADEFVRALDLAVLEMAPPAPSTPPPLAPTPPMQPTRGTVGPDPAHLTMPGLDDGPSSPPQPARYAEDDVATPRPGTISAAYDLSAQTIPPESAYQPAPPHRPAPTPPSPQPVYRPEPIHRPGTPPPPQPVYRPEPTYLPPSAPRPEPVRQDLALQPAPRQSPADPKPGPGFGLAPIAVVLLGVVGIWALATGQLESYLGMAIGIAPTPTVVISTRPEPTIASIVAELSPVATTAPLPGGAAGASSAVAAGQPANAPGAVASPPPSVATPPSAANPPPVAAAAPPAVPGPGAAPAALPPAPVAAAPPSPDQELQAAQAQIDSGEHAPALAALLALKERAPNTEGLDDALYRAYVGQGGQQLERGLHDESHLSYGEALTLRPDDPVALEGQKQATLGKLWATMEGAWDRDDAVASAALEEILALDPAYRDANQKLYALLVARATRSIEGGDVDGALVLLRRAQEIYPVGTEAPALIAAQTPPPEPTPEPTAQQPTPQSEPAPAPKPQQPAAKPAQAAPPPESQPITVPVPKPQMPSLPGSGSLPGLPRP